MTDKGEHTKENVTSTAAYTAVWLALLALLAATVAVARFQLFSRYSVLGSLVIATAKAGVVLAFFMHLRDEGWLLKGMLGLVLGALLLLIGMTFVDVWYR